jgi:hypothetical protein
MSAEVTTYSFEIETLDALGLRLRTAAYHGEDISAMLPTEAREVLMTALALDGRAPTLSEGFALITAHWNTSAELAESSQQRLAEVLSHAVTRAQSMGVTEWDEAFDEVVCDRFIHSVTTTHNLPSASTMHLRRSALRAGFTTLRRLGLFHGDPTLDLSLPARSQLAARAAVDDEIMLLRMSSVASRESRQPSVLALAEATATTSEMPFMTALDIDDVENPQFVQLPGTSRVRSRLGVLTPWGSRVIRRAIQERRKQGIPDSTPLVYSGCKDEEASGQASICVAMRSIVKRAGLGNEPDFSPRSVSFWAGRQAFDAAPDAKIEAAARAMGITSLDKAARRVDYSWDQP